MHLTTIKETDPGWFRNSDFGPVSEHLPQASSLAICHHCSLDKTTSSNCILSLFETWFLHQVRNLRFVSMEVMEDYGKHNAKKSGWFLPACCKWASFSQPLQYPDQSPHPSSSWIVDFFFKLIHGVEYIRKIREWRIIIEFTLSLLPSTAWLFSNQKSQPSQNEIPIKLQSRWRVLKAVPKTLRRFQKICD